MDWPRTKLGLRLTGTCLSALSTLYLKPYTKGLSEKVSSALFNKESNLENRGTRRGHSAKSVSTAPHRRVSTGGQPSSWRAGVCRRSSTQGGCLVLQATLFRTLTISLDKAFSSAHLRLSVWSWSDDERGEWGSGQGEVSPQPCSLSSCHSIRQVLQWPSSRSVFLLDLQSRRAPISLQVRSNHL